MIYDFYDFLKLGLQLGSMKEYDFIEWQKYLSQVIELNWTWGRDILIKIFSCTRFDSIWKILLT